MKWFLNLATRGKLFVGFGLMILLLAAVTVTAYRGIAEMQESQKKLYERDFANAVDLKDIRSNQNGAWAKQLQPSNSRLHNTSCFGGSRNRNSSKRNSYNRRRGKTDGSSIQSKGEICFRECAEGGSGFPER